MPLVPVELRPGIVRDKTNYSNRGGWYDSDKVRWRFGQPEKLGGWEKASLSTFVGNCRSLHDWVALDFSQYLGVGTHLKFYIVEGGTFFDITPIRRSLTLGADPIASTNGSGVVTITDTAHGAVANDFVTLSGASAFNGLTTGNLNKEHQIVTIVDANSYTVNTGGTANATGAGGGASVVAAYQINTGLDSTVLGTGWGAGTYGRGTWGSASSVGVTTQLRLWAQDNFGEDLAFCPRQGALYYWDKTGGLGARAVNMTTLGGASDVPTIAFQVMVSDIDRHVIAFGVNDIGSATLDPLLVRWSDQENAANWTASTTTTAGSYRLSSGSRIVGALKTKQEILIWTDAGLHSMQWVGPPYTFRFDVIAEGLTLASPNGAVVGANGVVYWFGAGQFYVYSGAVQTLPCPVLEFLLGTLNAAQAYKIFAASNPIFNEVAWFYQSVTGSEVGRYVLYNFVENVWSIGSMARTAWKDTAPNPIASGTNGYLYYHERGHDDDGAAMTAYVESSDFDLMGGDRYAFIKRIIPDINFRSTAGQVSLILKRRNFPGDSLATDSTNVVTPTTQQVHVRARARQAALRYQSSTLGTSWRIGTTRLDMQPDGKR